MAAFMDGSRGSARVDAVHRKLLEHGLQRNITQPGALLAQGRVQLHVFDIVLPLGRITEH
jgi:hypothetical protein